MNARCPHALLLAVALGVLTACGANGPDTTGGAVTPQSASSESSSSGTCTSTPAPGGDDLCAVVTLQSGVGGLETGDIATGSGVPVQTGETLTVQYTGWLAANGQLFDSSRGSGRQPFTFALGRGDVIKGWDQGLVGMRVGGKRRLVIPPDLAYGTAGRSPIPPNATLVFDIELVSAAPSTPAAPPTSLPTAAASPTTTPHP